MIAGSQTIADDRRRSQKIEHGSIFCDRLRSRSQDRRRSQTIAEVDEGVVSKETVVLRRWGSSIQKFGFINGVDNVNWPPYRDSKS